MVDFEDVVGYKFVGRQYKAMFLPPLLPLPARLSPLQAVQPRLHAISPIIGDPLVVGGRGGVVRGRSSTGLRVVLDTVAQAVREAIDSASERFACTKTSYEIGSNQLHCTANVKAC